MECNYNGKMFMTTSLYCVNTKVRLIPRKCERKYKRKKIIEKSRMKKKI